MSTINETQGKVIARLDETQRKQTVGAPVWCVCEQLKAIARLEADSAELLLQDLDVPEMSPEMAETKIKAFADERHKTVKGNCVGVGIGEAERILREFYGLKPSRYDDPGTSAASAAPAPSPKAEAPLVKLEDFF